MLYAALKSSGDDKMTFYMVLIITCLLCSWCKCNTQSSNPFHIINGNNSCTKGLLIKDKMKVLGSMEFKDETNVTGTFFRFKPRHEKDFTTLCSSDAAREKNTSNECSVTKIDDKRYVTTVSYVIDAEAFILNGSVLTGSLVTTNGIIPSNEIELPEFYDIRSTTGHLIINGREYSTHQLKEPIVTDQHLNITFICKSPAEPCLIELLTDSKNAVQGKGSVVFESLYERSEEIDVTIKYAACRLDREHNTIQLKVKIIVQDKADTSITLTLTWAIIVCVILGFSILINVVQSYFMYKNGKELAHYRNIYSKEFGSLKAKEMPASSSYRGTSDEESPLQLGAMRRRDNSDAASENTVDVDVHQDV